MWTATLMFLAALVCSADAQEETVQPATALQEMAFLEERRTRGAYESVVRIAFRYSDRVWSTFEHDPHNAQELKALAKRVFAEPTEWHAVLSGRTLGTVRGQPIQTYETYGDVALQKLSGEDKMPGVGLRTLTYSGWEGSPVRRPLVLLRQLWCSDPEGWHRVEETEVTETLHKALMALAEDSEFEEENPGWRQFGRSAFRVAEAFESRDGVQVLCVGAGPPDDIYSEGYYCFVRISDNDIQPLGHGVRVLDWGDFDNDGRSEFVFHVARYNEDGYLLAWDGLRKTTLFTWNYH